MTYHRLNCKSGGQDADKFKTARNSKTTQLTMIVPFTELDVIVESKKVNNFLMNNHTEKVHCYLKSRSCVIIAQNIRYYIPDNTTEMDQIWMDIKVTLNDTDTEE